MNVEDCTACQLFGHKFVEGRCTDCGDRDEPSIPNPMLFQEGFMTKRQAE